MWPFTHSNTDSSFNGYDNRVDATNASISFQVDSLSGEVNIIGDRSRSTLPEGLENDLKLIDKICELNRTGKNPDLIQNVLDLEDVDKHFEIKQVIGSGGNANIYTAFDKTLLRETAVKSLHKNSELHPEDQSRLMERFVVESRIMAQLDHPSIVPLYGLFRGKKGDELYLAMKRLYGRDYSEILKETVVRYHTYGISREPEESAMTERLNSFVRVCRAIEYAHSKNILHCDLKPANIMVGDYGQIYVMDWGIAHLKGAEKPQGENGRINKVAGTPSYMAPELIRGNPHTEQTDIFALGMMLFEFVTLKRPVRGNTIEAIIAAILKHRFESCEHHYSKLIRIHPAVKAIIARATAADPQKRYRSVAELGRDVSRFLRHQETTVYPDNFCRKLIRKAIRYRGHAVIVLAAAFLFFVSSAGIMLYTQLSLFRSESSKNLKLRHFQAAAQANANEIDHMFAGFQSGLKGLAYGAAFLLDGPEREAGKVYFASDFSVPEKAPRDFKKVPENMTGISVEHAVFRLLPDSDSGKTSYCLSRVSGFPRMCRFLMKKTFNTEFSDKDIFHGNTPIERVFLIVPEAFSMTYPGSDVPDPVDLKKRFRWIDRLQKTKSCEWTAPYFSPYGNELSIASALCFRTQKSNLNAVVGIEVGFDRLRKIFFDKNANLNIKRTLVDSKGILLTSSDFKDLPAQGHFVKKVSEYYNSVMKMREENKGILLYIDRDLNHRVRVVVIFQIKSLDIYYTEEILLKDIRVSQLQEL